MDEDWEPGQRPMAMPSQDSRGPSYDAAVERAEAAFAAVREVLADRPILDSVGDLAQLVNQLPPEVALLVDDQVRTDRDTPAAGKQTVFAVVAEMAMVTLPPVTPVRDQHGQEHDVIEPALQLGVRVLATPDTPAPRQTRAYYLHDRAEEALEDGEVGTYLTLVAQQLTRIAKNLDTEVTRWFPIDRDFPELEAEASRLRAVAASLTAYAPTAEALVDDDPDDDLDETEALPGDEEGKVDDPVRAAATEETLRRLPQTLSDILTLHRMENPNPLKDLDVLVDGGPLNGQTQHNDGKFWHGDDWYPVVDGVEHHYRLGTRSSQGHSTTLWFYQGLRHGEPR
jgi:hypothetical protein